MIKTKIEVVEFEEIKNLINSTAKKYNNFKDFLNRYRIEKAKEILRDDPSIKIVDLSAMVGFNSSNSFIRVFSKYEGITPGAYVDRIQHS